MMNGRRMATVLSATPLRKRIVVLSSCVASVAILTIGERYVGPKAGLGGLFLFPLFVAATYLPRIGVLAFAIAIAGAREYFDTNPWEPSGPVRLTVSLVVFTAGGLLAAEFIRNRRLSMELVRKTREEEQLRLEAATEMRALVESSPAAFLVVDSDGTIAKANEAAHRLLGFDSDSLESDSVEKYIPVLATLVRSREAARLRATFVEARGRRLDGQDIYIHAWVSGFPTASGSRISAVLLDVTDQIRDREESGLRQLLTNSRIIAGAVSHELRNLAAAASVLHLNLQKIPDIQESADYQALGTVIESVHRLASTELSNSSEEIREEALEIPALLRELRTMVTPKFADAGVRLEWEIAADIPVIRANRSALLQVLLNLAQNSCDVLQGRADGRLLIAAYTLSETVLIRLSDNGPGISQAERLFQPFQTGASSTGLGLFVSRAVIRTYGGDLHHTQRPGECSFIIELPLEAVRNARP